MKVYISGPIKGDESRSMEAKLDAFNRAENFLKVRGISSVNPLNLEAYCGDGPPENHSWACLLRADLLAMLHDCTHIMMLPGWEESPGARLENQIAVACGLKRTHVAWRKFPQGEFGAFVHIPWKMTNDDHI